MTQQEYFLQVAAMIAAAVHPKAFSDCDANMSDVVNTYAAEQAGNLLEEVKLEWETRTTYANEYGALFDTDPQQEEPETQEQGKPTPTPQPAEPVKALDDYDYFIKIVFTGGKPIATYPIIADNNMQAIEKAKKIWSDFAGAGDEWYSVYDKEKKAIFTYRY